MKHNGLAANASFDLINDVSATVIVHLDLLSNLVRRIISACSWEVGHGLRYTTTSSYETPDVVTDKLRFSCFRLYEAFKSVDRLKERAGEFGHGYCGT